MREPDFICADEFGIYSEGFMSTEWTAERAFQLELLQNLVSEAARINSASGIVERLQSLEDTAEELLCSDIANLKPSFMDFLMKLCVDARTEATKRSQQ